MAHQLEQKVALLGASRLDRIDEVRHALGEPSLLRHEAERLLGAIPAECEDLLTWSDEGYGSGLVASVLSDELGRELRVHRASLVGPLAPRLRETSWSWVCAEELLGVSEVRGWASDWAAARGGVAYDSSDVVLGAAL
jgi:hypothetical protein